MSRIEWVSDVTKREKGEEELDRHRERGKERVRKTV